MTSHIDHDTADAIYAGTLTAARRAARVVQLIGTDPAWADFRRRLTEAEAALRYAAESMPVLDTDPSPAGRVLQLGPLHIDLHIRRATWNGATVQTSAKTFELLARLAHEPERVIPKDELYREIWNYDHPERMNTRTLDSHASRLRRQLVAAGAPGSTVYCLWGVGYALRVPGLRVVAA